MPDTETVAEPAAAPPATPAKTKKSVKSKPRISKSHPKYKEMISEAITTLAERTGSSRQAITKYVKSNYNLSGKDTVIAHNIKQTLKLKVSSGEIVQTKGVGASGSFKLVSAGKSKTKPIKTKSKKATTKKPTKVVKKIVAKKSPKKKSVAAKTKKPVTKAKKPAAKKVAKPRKAPAKKKVVKKPASKAKKSK